MLLGQESMDFLQSDINIVLKGYYKIYSCYKYLLTSKMSPSSNARNNFLCDCLMHGVEIPASEFSDCELWQGELEHFCDLFSPSALTDSFETFGSELHFSSLTLKIGDLKIASDPTLAKHLVLTFTY
jgi:hypothetical protein